MFVDFIIYYYYYKINGTLYDVNVYAILDYNTVYGISTTYYCARSFYTFIRQSYYLTSRIHLPSVTVKITLVPNISFLVYIYISFGEPQNACVQTACGALYETILYNNVIRRYKNGRYATMTRWEKNAQETREISMEIA